MKNIIELINLTKYYGKIRGIDNLNLSLEKGGVLGFLGPNGAGKSTTIRLLLNLIMPTSGEIRIFGEDLRKNYKSIFSRIGYVPGELKLYEELTGEYFLDYMSNLQSDSHKIRKDLLTDFELTKKDLQKKIRYYSHGMKQKLGIIQALQSEPELVIMDEPSEGLDPLNKRILYDYIERFRQADKTIFFSSHNLSEVERICDRIGLVKDGFLIADETIEQLKSKMTRHMEVEFAQNIDRSIFDMPGVTGLKKENNTFRLIIQGDLNAIIKILSEHQIKKLVFPEPSLEDMFLTYYKKPVKV